jgi:hypothetical protein
VNPRARFALAAFALASAVPVAAVADDAAKPPLRHMVFGANVILKIQSQARGVYDVTYPTGATISTSTVNDNADGQIVCDVIGTSADGGLILEVSENSDKRKAGPTRVALQSDGALLYTQGDKPLNEEEVVLLKLLARGVIGSTPRTAGESWSVENVGDKYKSTTTFRVTSEPAPASLNLDLEEVYASTGAPAYAGTMHGSVNYDPRLSVPIKAHLERSTRSEKQDGAQTVAYTLDYTLETDSFKGK